MHDLELLIIPGSARRGSLNLALARHAAARAQASGARTTLFDLRALALPVYDGDFEAERGVPEAALQLLHAVQAADGVLIVTPEYNGFPTPLVINAFDWLSRVKAADGHPAGLGVTTNRPVALLSASPGPLGGLRSMNFLRQYLQMSFAMIVVPQQFALVRAGDAFDAEQRLTDERARTAVDGVLQALGALAGALSAARRAAPPAP
ncbi:MAG: NAD(P)H-dependent oxidoreductase [Rubrivivax sp.]